MFRAISAAAVLLCVASVPNHARAAEITLLSPGAVGSSLRELVPQFEQASGHKVNVGYSPALALVDKLKQGEIADVAIALVGPLPADIQFYTDYAAGVMTASQHQDAGKALIAYLATPAASAVMKSKGFTQF